MIGQLIYGRPSCLSFQSINPVKIDWIKEIILGQTDFLEKEDEEEGDSGDTPFVGEEETGANYP